MGGSDYDTVYASRIADANRTWQATCDTDVTNWTKTNEFIVAIVIQPTGHSGGAEVTMKVQWMKDTEGTWYDLGTTGELVQGTGTVLVNCTALGGSGDSCGCQTWADTDDSHEIEGANSCLIGPVAQNKFAEIQVAVDPSNATDGEKYSFRLYDVTEGAALNEALAEITMAAGATEHFQTVEDKAGLLDSVAKKQAFKKSVSDISGLLDSVATVKSMVQTASDITGLVDSVSVAKGSTQTVTELAGLLESVAFVGTYHNSPTDMAGLVDSVTVVHTPAGGGEEEPSPPSTGQAHSQLRWMARRRLSLTIGAVVTASLAVTKLEVAGVVVCQLWHPIRLKACLCVPLKRRIEEYVHLSSTLSWCLKPIDVVAISELHEKGVYLPNKYDLIFALEQRVRELEKKVK